MVVPWELFIGSPSITKGFTSKEKATAEPTGAVARRSWVLRGVAYCGVAEEARTRGFVPPAFAGFALSRRCFGDLKKPPSKGGPGAGRWGVENRFVGLSQKKKNPQAQL